MGPETAERLRAVNRRFYRDNAASFAGLRTRPWPGWRRLGLRPDLRVLDLGCGHGRFATFLERQGVDLAGYLGVDVTGALLDRAREAHPEVHFAALDVLTEDLSRLGRFDLVVAFGLLHHVPGRAHRADRMRAWAARVAPAGRLVVTLWRVEPPERARPWATLGVDPKDVEPGDHLLGWGPNPEAVRYAHAVDDVEAQALIRASGLGLQDDFRDDSGDRNRYLVLGAAP